MIENLVGFSDKINDPGYEKYRKASKKWSYIFSLILATVAVIGFPIYGAVSGDISFPYSLYYGFGIGGMFVAIAALQDLKRRKDTTWEGKIIDKKIYKKTKLQRVSNRNLGVNYTLYVLKIMREDGKVYSQTYKDNPSIFDYYQIGDRVKHHKAFNIYEKYDKSKDSQILCIACGTFNDIKENHCQRCRLPLLK
ncbi:MAG: hypothetical protein ACPLVG_04195 [Pseudothermotoga sp.]